MRRSVLAPLAELIARIRAPLSAKLLGAFVPLILLLLATAVVSLITIARIEDQVTELHRLDQAVGQARGLDYSILAQEHLSSMFVLTGEAPNYDKLRVERDRFRATATRLAGHGMPPRVAEAIDRTFARYVEASEEVVAAKTGGRHDQARRVHVEREHLMVDVVCTDLGMPGMNGWQLADQIRERWPRLYVGLMTGWGARIDTDELQAHRVDFLIAKPFSRDQILETLAQVDGQTGR